MKKTPKKKTAKPTPKDTAPKPKKPGYGTLTSGHILVRAPRELVTLAAKSALDNDMPQQAWWRNAARAALGIREGME